MINFVILHQNGLVSLNFTIENYGIKLIYNEIDTPHTDMCFGNIIKTHSVY